MDTLSGKVHKEIEDRFDLKALPKETAGVKPAIIRQGVLREVKKGDDVVAYARIRSYDEPGKTIKYSLGVKHFPLSQESETSISKEMFEAFYPNHLDKPQEKKRYVLDKGWIIDEKKDGGIVAERERTSNTNESQLPEGWEKRAAFMDKLALRFNAMPIHGILSSAERRQSEILGSIDTMNNIRQREKERRKLAFYDELDKLGFISVYDPKRGRPQAKVMHESVDLPVIVKRDYADEMGGAISSGGSPMSTGG
jgi:hypothetical protein